MDRAQRVTNDAGVSPELSLREQREALERERTELEEFVAMAAHELLTPLVLTESCATTIAERAGPVLDAESLRDLETLLRVSSSMRVLVEGLLFDARDRDKPLRRQPVDVGVVVNDCVEMLSGDIRARNARVEVEPLPTVRGNAALLRAVFWNLLSNALKYASPPGAVIRVTATRGDGGWTFAVESPGPPIPDSDRRSMFEPWERGRNSRGSPGVGLGLAIVRRIVERHGGTVGVASPAGRANRVYFTLPG